MTQTKLTYYAIWRRHQGQKWLLTAHSLVARTDEEAQGKLRRKFAGCGFHDMSMVAMPTGHNPNEKSEA